MAAAKAARKASRSRSKASKRTRRKDDRDALPIAELETMRAPYNPNRLEGARFDALRASLAEFGAVGRIVVNRRTRTIVGGHQRLEAAALEGFEQYPVEWVDLSLADEQRLNLALNNVHGDLDDAALRAVIRGLADGGADMKATGFSDAEVARILAAPPAAPAAEGGDTDSTARTCPQCGYQL